MKNFLLLLLFLNFLQIGKLSASSFTIEVESMTLGGSYAGKITSPFSGVGFYGNGDIGSTNANFTDGTGNYIVSITGASSNTTAAGISLYVNGTKLKGVTFSTTTATTVDFAVKITVPNSPLTVALKLETDNGSNNTYIDKVTFTYVGPIIVRNPPVLPAQGAYYTDTYRNMFVEAGYSATDVNTKIQNIWQQLFYGDATTQALFYPVGTDKAYILDVNNGDVRSEGMSYGMMICVQMDKQTEFNMLWNWAKTYMQNQTGIRSGYFAWQLGIDGTVKDANPAPDGEEYFAMALMFASNRWGNGTGIYNYKLEANKIINNMISRVTVQSVTPMINPVENQVVFVPYGNSATYTDPSYHLPAFYQLFGMWADSVAVRPNWLNIASKSRTMFPKFANSTTGLMPDYANFNGTAYSGTHGDFRFDAWRCAMNMAVDYAWFQADTTEVNIISKIHSFFNTQGIGSYGNQYTLAGVTSNSSGHSPGLIACNAGGSLASKQAIAWDFIDELWVTSIPSGTYRYYDGMLYFMNYLHLSGNFKIYKPFIKPKPTISTLPTLGVVNCRQKLSDVSITGGEATYNGSTVNGTFAFKTPTTKLDFSDSGVTSFILLFTPVDTRTFDPTEINVTVEVTNTGNCNPCPSPTGYFMVDCFDGSDVGDTYSVYKAENPTSASTATVVIDPVVSSNQVILFANKNWGHYLELNVTLPCNRTLNDYQSVAFDVYCPTGIGSYQTLNFGINKNMFATTNNGSNTLSTWTTLERTFPTGFSTYSGLNSFTFELGFRLSAKDYYIDKVVLKEKAGLTSCSPTLITQVNVNPLWLNHSDNILTVINGNAKELVVYSIEGQLIVSKNNISYIDISNLTSGIYIVKASINDKIFIEKIIKR